MKKKGFTLVELLAVIVILAIVLIIAVPGVLSIINQTKNSAYDRQVDMIKEATKNYITANSITWTGDNPKSTLVTLDMLQSGGYLDKKLLDPRDKKEILCANVLVTKNQKNKISYDVDMTCNEDQPITPILGSGMIPIVYDGTNWVKADVSNKNFAWFNYGNQQWANMATVTEDVRQTLLDASIGTVVPLDKINAMFVWIPRFKYKLFNVDGTVSPVGNKNLVGDYKIDIQFETKETAKSTGTQNGEWLTHPAFTFGGQELNGFWVSKFDVSSQKATTTLAAEENVVEPNNVLIRPNSYIWRGLDIYHSYYNAQGIKNAGNVFGLSSEEDSHMMKNMEWGAMAYLTGSRYGKTGNPNYGISDKEVVGNTDIDYRAGRGASKVSAGPQTDTYSYETPQGHAASTTGNISGIYDTAGGAWNFVAAVMKSADGANLLTSLSGFPQDELNQIGAEGKYLDVYEYGTSHKEDVLTRGKLGDGTKEFGPFTDGSDIYESAWYHDFAHFLNVTPDGTIYSWFVRGANKDYYSRVGVNAYARETGGLLSTRGFSIVLPK